MPEWTNTGKTLLFTWTMIQTQPKLYLVYNKFNGSAIYSPHYLIQAKGNRCKSSSAHDSGATGVLIDDKFAKAKGFAPPPLARAYSGH